MRFSARTRPVAPQPNSDAGVHLRRVGEGPIERVDGRALLLAIGRSGAGVLPAAGSSRIGIRGESACRHNQQLLAPSGLVEVRTGNVGHERGNARSGSHPIGAPIWDVSAPIGVPTVKRVWQIHPVTLPAVAWAGRDCDVGFSSSLRFCAVARTGVKLERPQRRAGRRGRRTNELDAVKRRPMMRSGEEPFPGVEVCTEGRWLGFPRAWLVVGVVSHAPIRLLPRRAGAHDRVIRGPGCSVRSSSAAVGPAHAETRARPGAGDPPR
jgi:hypothetical protein